MSVFGCIVIRYMGDFLYISDKEMSVPKYCNKLRSLLPPYRCCQLARNPNEESTHKSVPVIHPHIQS